MDTSFQASDGSEHGKSRKGKRSRYIAVRTIKGHGEAALVQWDDRGTPKCVSVPRDELRGGKVKLSILKAGIPYGCPWSEIFKDYPGVADEMYRANIYTFEDFKRGLTTVRAILTRALVNPLVDRLLRELGE